MNNNEKDKLAVKLLQLDEETFKAVKEVLVDPKIKFFQGPVYEQTFNINIIKKLNSAQLKYLFGLIEMELKERGVI